MYGDTPHRWPYCRNSRMRAMAAIDSLPALLAFDRDILRGGPYSALFPFRAAFLRTGLFLYPPPHFLYVGFVFLACVGFCRVSLFVFALVSCSICALRSGFACVCPCLGLFSRVASQGASYFSAYFRALVGEPSIWPAAKIVRPLVEPSPPRISAIFIFQITRCRSPNKRIRRC